MRAIRHNPLARILAVMLLLQHAMAAFAVPEPGAAVPVEPPNQHECGGAMTADVPAGHDQHAKHDSDESACSSDCCQECVVSPAVGLLEVSLQAAFAGRSFGQVPYSIPPVAEPPELLFRPPIPVC